MNPCAESTCRVAPGRGLNRISDICRMTQRRNRIETRNIEERALQTIVCCCEAELDQGQLRFRVHAALNHLVDLELDAPELPPPLGR